MIFARAAAPIIMLPILAAAALADVPGASGAADQAHARRNASAAAGRALPDFDGDGRADLAIGAPNASNRHRRAGEVHVLYGSSVRPHLTRRQLLGQGRDGLKGDPHFGELFGWALAAADFDGDGFSDLAINTRFDRVGRVKAAGSVHVVHGSSAGLSTVGNKVWTQKSRGIADSPGRMDQFGWSMAAADFDGDGHDDLAVGAHYEDRGAQDSGVVHVLYGSDAGLTAQGSQYWHQDSRGIDDRAEFRDQFGRTLAAEDFDGDGFFDLAIGSPYEGGRVGRTGIVHVLHGSRRGLTAQGSQRWSQDSPGIRERSEHRDQFGQSLAAGRIDGDRFGDLVVGVWFEDYQNLFSNEGGFHVIYGSPGGLRAAGNEFWSEDSPGIADTADFSDEFGKVLTVGNFDGDGFDDIAVGAPTADQRANVHANEGKVHVFRGSRGGVTPIGDRVLIQGRGGVADRAEPVDNFASALAAADIDGDGYADLVAGVPWEDRRATDDGLVQVIHGSARGVNPRRETLVTITRRGFGDRPRRGARFGWSLSGEARHAGVPRIENPDE